MKWILLALGALVVYQLINRQSSLGAASGSSLLGGSKYKTGFSGAVDSLTDLTNSIGKLFGSRSETAITNPDGLITPNY